MTQPRALPRGTRIQRFEIVQVLAETSLALVYLAIDHERQVEVAIKEYMPLRLAQRVGERVQSQAPADAEMLARGLRAFISEARLLAKAQHPSLARMIALIEANATAYQVMPRYLGKSLLQVRQEMAEPPDERALRALFDALLGALEALHHQGQLHRGVAPAKILLLPDDRPLLLGPGSARDEVASGLVETLMAAVEPSFAAPEQRPPANPEAAGPWSDLFSLAQTIRFCLSGELPPPASAPPERARHERTAQMVRRLFGDPPTAHYSAALLGTLDAMLAPLPGGRPQSVDEIRRLLAAAPPVESDAAHPAHAFGRTAPMAAAPATRIEPAFDLDIDLSRGDAFGHAPVAAPSPRADPRPSPMPDPMQISMPRSLPNPMPGATPGAMPSPPRVVVRRRRTLGRALWAGGAATLLLGAALATGWWLNDAVGIDSWPLQALAQRPTAPVDPRAITDAAPPGAGPQTATPEAGTGAAAMASPSAAETAASASVGAPASTSMKPAAETAAMRAAPEMAGGLPPAAATPATPPTPVTAAPPAALPEPPAPMAAPPAAPAQTHATAPQSSAAPSTVSTTAEPATPPSASSNAPNPAGTPEASATPAPPPAPMAESATRAKPAAAPTRSAERNGRAVPTRTARRAPPPVDEPTEKASTSSPREACAGRSQFSLYRCMQVQCVQSMWIHHPQCARLRATDTVD